MQAQDDLIVKADWKKRDFSWHLKVDSLSIVRTSTNGQFQVDDAETEKAHKEKLPAV